MNISLNHLTLGFTSFLLGLILIPIIIKIAICCNFIDKPNYRKVHTKPVPLVGGISIAFVFFIVLSVFGNFYFVLDKYLTILAGATLLLIIGIIDDKTDISARYKLIIQFVLATMIAHSGTRITSLYGFIGINEIPIYWQYILTVVVITGVVNAFNLIDGVDGLVGGLSFLGFTMFAFAAFYYKNNELLIISIIFMGALISFLWFNLSRKYKIFMGDSGSLFLGFLLVTLGIHLLESHQISKNYSYAYPFLLLVSFFSIPVLDSIRVYLGRIKNGNSPFMADKSHLHHLLLSAGLTHKKIALFVVLMCMIMFFIGFGLISFFSTTLFILVLIFVFVLIIRFLLMINNLNYWKIKIKQIENFINY
jgi:UDP-GlcNAc:undecaprenyl-phosphate GlcNAc-1-phosphate transferase